MNWHWFLAGAAALGLLAVICLCRAAARGEQGFDPDDIFDD